MQGLAVGEKPGFEQKARIPSVDGLRALAFTLVFLYHSWAFAGMPHIPVVTGIVAQNTRPDLFVVLTGFALYLPFALDPSRHGRFRTGPYVERRIKRIVIPYYAALALPIGLPYLLKAGYSMLGRDTNPTDPVTWGDLASHLTFTHMFFPAYWDSINGSLWTMSLEMQLYLLFPVVVLLVARWGLWALVPLSVLSVVWHVVTPFSGQWPEEFLWNATAIGRLTEFMAGMVASVIVMRLRHRLTRWWMLTALAVFILGYTAATGPLSGGRIPVRELGLSVAFGGLIVLAIGAKPVEAFFGSRPVARLGYMAYSMFLVHQPIVYYFSEGLERVLGVPEGHGELVLLWTVGFAVVFVVGWLFFRFIEEPCIRWSKAVAKRPASAGSTPP